MNIGSYYCNMKRFTKEEIEVIKRNYGVKTYKETGIQLGRSTDVIKQKSRLLNLPSCGIGQNKFSRKKRKFDCDDNYFNIINKQNSYWAGFIAADGYIYDKTRESISLSIMLAEKDKDHLLNFKKAINTDKPLWEGTSNGFKSCSLTLASKQICKDLENNFNITPRKSFTLKFPNFKNNLLKDKFIQGYIDGDGCITVYGKYPSISILGNHDFLLEIKNRFHELTQSDKCIYLYKKKNLYEIIVRNKEGLYLYNYFKNLEGMKLERKWNKNKVLEGIIKDSDVVDLEESQG